MHAHLLPLLFPLLATAVSLDCSKVVADGARWDLSKLSGPRTVHELARVGEGEGATVRNTTYTIDICRALTKEAKDGCVAGTRVCAQIRHYAPADYEKHVEPRVEEVWSIAGEFLNSHGGALDPIPHRLKTGESAEDSKKEGVRIALNGGVAENMQGLKDVKQRAYVDFICDKKRTGLEPPRTVEDGERGRVRRRDDEDGKDEDGDREDGDGDKPGDPKPLPNPDEGSSLQFTDYTVNLEKDDNVGTLRLEWRTKYACEDEYAAPDDGVGRDKSTGGWGFFTWFIIILFLATAAYIIFGSWMNYSRYGARGWDLLPHGDTIRDVPYLLKDWARRVFSSSTSGGGSRGGYSAI